MDFTRRTALAVAGGVVLGVAGTLGEATAETRLDENTPLPFYGSAVSAIRPDRSAPGANSAAVIWGGPAVGTRVALTFDDGPHPDWTPRVLAALARADIPATFFCLGRNVRDHGEMHRDSVDRHELANHTFDHPELGRFGLDRCRDEIGRTGDLMERTYGVRPTLFRPPYGHIGGAAVLAAAEARLTTVLWSVQAREDRFRTASDGVVADIVRQLRPGSIILTHDTGSRDRLITIDRLGRLVDAAHAAGYTFATVSDLLTSDIPSA